MITVYRCRSRFEILKYGITDQEIQSALAPLHVEKLTDQFVVFSAKHREKKITAYTVFFLSKEDVLEYLKQCLFERKENLLRQIAETRKALELVENAAG